jgi:alpha-glucosidase
MKNTKLARSEIVDPLGKKFWPIYKGRDVSRTPMQWDKSDYAGFSDVRPWLPVNSDYEKVNAAAQMKDRYSILNLYRKLISLRKKNKALTLGEWIPVVKGKSNVLAYFRIYNDETIFIALNFSSAPHKVKAGNRGQWRVILSTHRTKFEHFTELNFLLLPNEATIIKKIGEL